MTSGQYSLFADHSPLTALTAESVAQSNTMSVEMQPLPVYSANDAEQQEHEEYLSKMKQQSAKVIWADD